jgi:lactoylglutathione lyase
MQPTLGYTIFFVPSVSEAIDFYERAFGFSNSFIHEAGDYGQLQTGTTALAFTSHALAAQAVPFTYAPSTPKGPRPGMEITLVAPDVDALFDRAVAAGATPLSPPCDKPWGQRVAYVADINGFPVGLGTPMSPPA